MRVPLADSTLVPTPDNVTDKEALLVGDVLPTGVTDHRLRLTLMLQLAGSMIRQRG